MSNKQKPHIVLDPTKCKHGTWPGSPLVDGRFKELMEEYVLALEELAMRLYEAEDGGARGQGVPELPGLSNSGNQSHVEQRINPNGYMADKEVTELRKMRSDWLKQFRRLVQDAQRDLGQRELLKGPRDRFGRLRILSD